MAAQPQVPPPAKGATVSPPTDDLTKAFKDFLGYLLQVLGISAAVIFGVWSIKSYNVSKQSLTAALEANSLASAAAGVTPAPSFSLSATIGTPLSVSLLNELQLNNRIQLFLACQAGLASVSSSACSNLASEFPFRSLVDSALSGRPTAGGTTGGGSSSTSRGGTAGGTTSSGPSQTAGSGAGPDRSQSLSLGAIVGIVLGAVAAAIFGVGAFLFIRQRKLARRATASEGIIRN